MTDIARLHEFLVCDAEAGELVWRERPRGYFASDTQWKVWNARFAGKRALNAANGSGYLRGMVDWRKHFAHRVIWAMTHGAWPADEIDHINGDKHDNRISNLRVVDRMENNRNASLRKDNKTGAAGVSKCGNRYAAFIRSGRNRVNLGRFGTIEDAASARKAAEAELGFHANHGRVS